MALSHRDAKCGRKNESALKTLEAAAHANPDNRMIRARQSDILRRLDRKDEAEAAAKSAVDETDDMEAINDATYVLAEIDRDLPYAEEASRKGIAALEARTAAIGPSEANNHAFAQANLLFASWDTLGWILFREGKFEQAEPLLLAGWRNSLVAHRGNHLAQLYEATVRSRRRLRPIAWPPHPSKAPARKPMWRSTLPAALPGSGGIARHPPDTTRVRRCKQREPTTWLALPESQVGEPSGCRSAPTA